MIKIRRQNPTAHICISGLIHRDAQPTSFDRIVNVKKPLQQYSKFLLNKLTFLKTFTLFIYSDNTTVCKYLYARDGIHLNFRGMGKKF